MTETRTAKISTGKTAPLARSSRRERIVIECSRVMARSTGDRDSANKAVKPPLRGIEY
jgi:hypothetical protein